MPLNYVNSLICKSIAKQLVTVCIETGKNLSVEAALRVLPIDGCCSLTPGFTCTSRYLAMQGATPHHLIMMKGATNVLLIQRQGAVV